MEVGEGVVGVGAPDVAQSVEREALNLVVAGSSPVVGFFPVIITACSLSLHR